MAAVHADDRPRAPRSVTQSSATSRLILSRIEVRRKGRVEPLLHAHPTLSSSPARWSGVALEEYSVPACVIPRHEHVENFLHVVLQGSVAYEVLTRGKTLQFSANPGTTFILPRGTVDELRWSGPTHRLVRNAVPRWRAGGVYVSRGPSRAAKRAALAWRRRERDKIQ